MGRKPTQEELAAMIDKGLGTLLTPREIEDRKKSNQLAPEFKVDEGFGVYRVTFEGEEYFCVTNILCNVCQRLDGGKVKRCEAHKRKKRGRKGKKGDGEVVDDMSDRDKIGGLRHVNDDEDEEDKIEGAFTPDAVMTPGIGGAIIIVPVDARNNERAGPPAKGLNHVKGVLVRGAGNIPQFIPNDRLTKAHKLRFDNYLEGELNLINGKEIFVPNNLGAAKMDGKNSQAIANAAVADKVDQKIVDAIGKDLIVAVQVDVADNGMPVMRVLEGKPKDKETPVGIIVKTADDQIQFVQITGKELGGGKDAKLMPCTIPENAKMGDVVADLYINADGKAVAAKPGEIPPGGKAIGQVVVGQNDQLVFVPTGANKDECIKNGAQMTPAMKEKLELAQANVQATVTGQTPEHIQGQVNRIGEAEAAAASMNAQKNNSGGPPPGASAGEVRSVGFGAQQFGGSQFARPTPAGGGGAGGGGGGGNGKVYSNGEVRSVAFGAQGAGGSVFAKPSGTGGGYAGAGGKAGGASGGAGGGGGGAGGGGAKGAGGGGGGGAGGGGANEVRSVAFGGNQYGASVMAKGSGGGGAGAAKNSAGAGKKANNNNNNNYGSGAEVKSVGFGAQQYGASVFMRK
ncbi:hypothetical protein CRE_30085 [Caenorhabditis remanei]|uniref:Uncharacterized protein n=1 Tax=Caenorhabditis remanei TaxID=31234 RepID=E3MYD1_CAERE|nr:hypothetical protein CRE_30085 [Caenorhabditis remanei]